MPDVYFHEKLMVIPVEGINSSKIFNPISGGSEFYKPEQTWREEYRVVLENLAEKVPTVFNGSELAVSQDLKLWAGFRFVAPRTIGRADCHVRICDDLGFSLAHHKYGYFGSQDLPLVHQLAKQSGVLVDGNYQFGTEPDNMGAYYGSEFSGLNEILNLLYREYTKLTPQSLAEIQKLLINDNGSMNLNPGIARYRSFDFASQHSSHKIEFPLRDLSSVGIDQADQHIGEFAAWMQQDATKEHVLSVATSLSYALKNYGLAENLGEREDIYKGLPVQARVIGDSWLEEAAEKFGKIHPPRNDRMKIVLEN